MNNSPVMVPAPKISRRLSVILLAAACLLAACAQQDAGPLAPESQAFESRGDGFLAIEAEPAHEISPGIVEVRATIGNVTDRTFYALLGDGFNAAVDQQQLYAAQGSDGAVERWVHGRGWEQVAQRPLIEGARVIEIRPHRTYDLVGLFDETRATGLHPQPSREHFRLSVRYFDDPGTSPDQAHQDYSNTFRVD